MRFLFYIGNISLCAAALVLQTYPTMQCSSGGETQLSSSRPSSGGARGQTSTKVDGEVGGSGVESTAL